MIKFGQPVPCALYSALGNSQNISLHYWNLQALQKASPFLGRKSHENDFYS